MATHVASADDADALALRNKAVTEFASVIATLDGIELDASEGDASGASARCLLYSATVDNPNFWWGDDGRGLDTQRAAEIISSASGPSGPNVDYLRNLGAFLREIGRTDAHVAALESKVDAILAGGGSESSSNSREV